MKKNYTETEPFSEESTDTLVCGGKPSSRQQSVTQEWYQKCLKQQSTKIKSIVPVRMSTQGSHKSSGFSNRPNKNKKPSYMLSSRNSFTQSSKSTNRSKTKQMIPHRETVQIEDVADEKPRVQPPVPLGDFHIQDQFDENAFVEMRNQTGQFYYVDDDEPRDTHYVDDVDEEEQDQYDEVNGQIEEMMLGQGFYSNVPIRNSQQMQQFSYNMMSDSNPIEITMLDMTHATNNTNPTQFGQMYSNNFENALSQQVKSDQFSDLVSPIQPSSHFKKKPTDNNNVVKKSRNAEGAETNVILRDYRPSNRIPELLRNSKKQRSQSSLGSTSKRHNNNQSHSMTLLPLANNIENQTNANLFDVTSENSRINQKQKGSKQAKNKKALKPKIEQKAFQFTFSRGSRGLLNQKNDQTQDKENKRKPALNEKVLRAKQIKSKTHVVSKSSSVPRSSSKQRSKLKHTRGCSLDSINEPVITNVALKQIELNIPIPKELIVPVEPSPQDFKVNPIALEHAYNRGRYNNSNQSSKPFNPGMIYKKSSQNSNLRCSTSTFTNKKRSSFNEDIDLIFDGEALLQNKITSKIYKMNKVQHQRIKKVQDRIHLQQMKLAQQENVIRKQQEQFQRIVELSDFDGSSMGAMNNLNNRSSIQSGESGQAQKLQQIVHHSKNNNSMQTAQFVNEAEYYFSSTRSVEQQQKYQENCVEEHESQEQFVDNVEPPIQNQNYRSLEVPDRYYDWNQNMMNQQQALSAFENFNQYKNSVLHQQPQNIRKKDQSKSKRNAKACSILSEDKKSFQYMSRFKNQESNEFPRQQNLSRFKSQQRGAFSTLQPNKRLNTQKRTVSTSIDRRSENQRSASVKVHSKLKKNLSVVQKGTSKSQMRSNERTLSKQKSKSKRRKNSNSITRKSIHVGFDNSEIRNLKSNSQSRKGSSEKTSKRKRLVHKDKSKFSSTQTALTTLDRKNQKFDDTLEILSSQQQQQHQNLYLHLSPGETHFQEFNDSSHLLQNNQTGDFGAVEHVVQPYYQQQQRYQLETIDELTYPDYNQQYEIQSSSLMNQLSSNELQDETLTTDQAFVKYNLQTLTQQSPTSIPIRKVIQLESMEKRRQQLLLEAQNKKRSSSTSNQRASKTVEQGRSSTKSTNFKSSLKMFDFSNFDNKSTILSNQMNHKNKVYELKNQFLSQKVQEKRILQQQILLGKMSLSKIKKYTKQCQSEKRRFQELFIELQKSKTVKENKTKIGIDQMASIPKDISRIESETADLHELRTQLLAEEKQEIDITADIHFIVLKYKKLIAEQKREKEALIQSVHNQRKILTNLQNRKAVVKEDISKLYDNFKTTIFKDEVNGIKKVKKLRISKQDKEVLKFLKYKQS